MSPSKSKRSSKRSWWSSLPTDLLEDIFQKTPIESLVRCKFVCKQWCALLNNKRFIYNLNLSQEQHFIRLDGESIQLFNLETQALTRLQGPSDISTMIHCDGLLLCSCTEERSRRSRYETIVFRNQLAVWNPFLNRVKWIKLSHSYSTSDVYGFGYDNVSRDNYKILRFDKGDKYVEIYEFKSKLWRSVEYATLGCRGVKLWRAQFHAVSVNGNMHWIAKRDSNSELVIQSFDFSTEKFKHICCLPFQLNWFGKKKLHAVDLSGFGGDRLSLLHQDNHKKMIEVWVTNKVTDSVVLVSKYFNVSYPNLPLLHSSHNHRFFTYFIHKTNNIMVWSESDFEKKSVYPKVYEMGEGKIKKLVETGPSKRSGSLFDRSYVNYVPSLVPIPD